MERIKYTIHHAFITSAFKRYLLMSLGIASPLLSGFTKQHKLHNVLKIGNFIMKSTQLVGIFIFSTSPPFQVSISSSHGCMSR